MNIFETVSEKFRGTNAATMIANYPTRFVKLLVKALDKVGNVRDKIKGPEEAKTYQDYIFRKDNRGRLTTGFPQQRLSITIDPLVSTRHSYGYRLGLEFKKPSILEVSPTDETINLTKKTVGEVIDHLVNNVKSKKERTLEPKEFNLKSLRKMTDARHLKIKSKYYGGMGEEYDHAVDISSKSNKPLTVPEKIEIHMLLPKIFKWYEMQGAVLVRHGISGGSDYYYLQSANATETNRTNKEEYARVVKNKSRYILNIFGDKTA